MASSYTEGLVIELIGSGDKAGSWGDVTNSNLQALNQGVSGFSDIDLSSQSSPYSIDLLDAQAASESTSPSRSSVIRFYGHSDGFVVNFQINGTASTRINCIIVNGHASSSLVVGTGAGGTVTIPATYSARVHGDGSGLENSFANLSVTKLALGNQEVISNTVDDRVDIVSSTLQIGDGSGAAVIQSDGTGTGDRDLILRNSTTNTGSIRIHDANNGDIDITTDGTGEVNISKVDIADGEIDGTVIGGNSAAAGTFTTLGATDTSTLAAINASGNIATSGSTTITAANGLIATAGGLTVTAGGITVNSGATNLTGGGITNAGSISGAGSISAVSLTTSSGDITANSGDIEVTAGNLGVGVAAPAGSGNISANGLITTSGGISTTGSSTIVSAGRITSSGGLSAGGTITGASSITASGNILTSANVNGQLITAATGLRATTGGLVISSGGIISAGNVNLNSGGISAAGTISGAGSITATGLISTSGNIETSGSFIGNIEGGTTTGNVIGNVEGNVTGNVTGNVVGSISGGNVSGNGSGLTGTASSFTAGNVTTNAALTGDVQTTSGNATRIASGVIVNDDVNANAAIAYSKMAASSTAPTWNQDTTGSAATSDSTSALATSGTDLVNVSSSSAPSNGQVLTATGPTAATWQDSSVGDLTGIDNGTNINITDGGTPTPAVNLDSDISLTSVTTTGIIRAGGATFAGGAAYISAEGGFRSSTYTSRSLNQAIDISPNGTGKLNLEANTATNGNSGIDIVSQNSPVLISGGTSSANAAASLIIFRTFGSNVSDSKFVINSTGSYVVTPTSGNRYLSMCSYGGPAASGFRNDTSGNMEIRSKNLALGATGADGWGRAYHSGMVTGDGAYFEGTCVVTANTEQTLDTGFNSIPSLVTCYLECTTANANYSIGDHVLVSSNSAGSTGNTGISVTFDGSASNDVTVTIATGGVYLTNKTTNVETALTESSWRLRVKAWK